MTTTEALEFLDLTAPISREGLERAYQELAGVWHPGQFAGNAALQAKAVAKSDLLYEAYLWLHGRPEDEFPFRLADGGALANRRPPRVPRRSLEPAQPTAAWESAPVQPEMPVARQSKKPLTLPPPPPEQVRRRGTGVASAGDLEDVPAPFMRRVGACVIDAGILLCLLFGVLLVREYRANMAMASSPAAFTSTPFLISMTVCAWLYFVLLECSPMQGSLGKRLLGLVVTGSQGEPAGFGRAALRALGMLVSFVFPPVFFATRWTKNRQCLHDLLAGCQVVWRLPAESAALVVAEEERKQLSMRQIFGMLGGLVAAAVVRTLMAPQQTVPWVRPDRPYVPPALQQPPAAPPYVPGLSPLPAAPPPAAPSVKEIPVVAPPPAAAARAQLSELPLAELRTQALQGDAAAQRQLGIRFYVGSRGAAMDQAEAAVWFRKAAAQGDAEGQHYLGWCYLAGNGVAKDGTLAVQWLQKAVAQGNAGAMHALAGAYMQGMGVPLDLATCRQWLLKAAELGLAEGQCDLALMYLKGQGGPQDFTEAVRWLRKAAAQGLSAAQYEMGLSSYNGEGGLPKSPTEAARWYRLAADQGNVFAQLALGRQLASGDGVARDAVAAMQWLLLAAAQKGPQSEVAAAAEVAQLKQELTPEQLAEAQRRADQFRPGPQLPPAVAEAPATAPPPAAKPAEVLEHLPADKRLSTGAVLADTLQNQQGKGTLKLDNGLTEDAFVKLIRAGKLVASFYVRGGQKFAFEHIPDGSYELLYCTGFGWNADRHDFARGRRATRHDNSLIYHTETKTEGGSTNTYVDILSLTLHKIVNGNAPTTDISLEEFDRY